MRKSTQKGLGRGFDSLIPATIDPQFDPTREKDQTFSRTQNVLISDIKPNPEQPRREIRGQELSDLAASIKIHGILQPLVLVRSGNHYLIIAGERRWRAARQVGLKEVPAIVRTLDNQAKLEVALIENVQREDLSPLELATALLKLNQQFNLSLEELSKRLGKAPSTLGNTMRLLQLPSAAKQALAAGRITEGHARQILALDDDPKKQQQLLDLILKHDWSVRRAEQFVTDVKQGINTDRAQGRSALQQTKETEELTKVLRAKVYLQPMARGRGRIIIAYKDEKDQQRLINRLSEKN